MKIAPLLAAGATTLALAAAPAAAGSDVDGFTIDGFVEGGYSWGGPFPGVYALGDIAMRVGLPGGLGLNLEVVAGASYDGTFGGTYEFYPTVSYNYGIGEASVGIPRSVLDRGYLPGRDVFGSAGLIGESFRPIYGSFLQTAYATNFGTPIAFVPVGLRWDGTFGQTTVGVSGHYLIGDGAFAFAGAARHELDGFDSFDDLAVFGGAEVIYDGGFAAFTARAGAEAGFGRATLGAIYGYSSVAVGHAVTAYGDYRVTDAISVDGSLSYFFTPGLAIATVGAEYAFMSNGYANASFGVPIGGGGGPTVEVSVGWRF